MLIAVLIAVSVLVIGSLYVFRFQSDSNYMYRELSAWLARLRNKRKAIAYSKVAAIAAVTIWVMTTGIFWTVLSFIGTAIGLMFFLAVVVYCTYYVTFTYQS